MSKKLHLTGVNADGSWAHVLMPVPPEFQNVTGEIHGEIIQTSNSEMPGTDLEKDNLYTVIRFWLNANKKVQAIIQLRQYYLYQTGERLGLKDAKDFIERYMVDNGYSL